MSKCNHVVAVFGENQITQDDFEQAAKDWVKKVKFYNENTLRIQITPPANLICASYCMNCGDTINKQIYESIIHNLMANNGDGRETYDKIKRNAG